MRHFFTIIMSLFLTQVFCQATFSKTIDLDPDARRNYIRDMMVAGDKIITQSIQFCSQDTTSFVCGTMTQFDLSGEIITSKYNYETAAYFDGPGCLNFKDNILYYSTNLHQDSFKKTTLIGYNLLLEEQLSQSFEGPESKSNIDNRGIAIIDNNMYIYGIVHNESGVPDSAQIIKTSLEGNVLWKKYYSYASSGLTINNLQATPDGNLSFIFQINSPNGANNGFDGTQLIKIDTAGNVMDSFTFMDTNKQPNRLLVTSNHRYVFSSTRNPFNSFDTAPPGRMHNMDALMDSLEWSFILPNDQLVDGRQYNLFDFIEAQNGDIVACGMAYDNTDTELATGVPDKNSTWNGFIVRISPDGEIKWLRLYKNPNNLSSKEDDGRFRPSRLNKIKELADGRLIAAGDVFVNSKQLAVINEEETEAFHLWLLMVDAEGCIENYDCEEIIRLDQSEDLQFAIGSEWIYEEVYYFGPYTNLSSRSFSIQDSFSNGNRTKFFLDTNDTFYVENSKMYFWDSDLQEYIMYYDWQETESYDIKYYDQFRGSVEIASVFIDSISYMHFGADSLKVQHVHIENSGTSEEYTDIVIEGVGAGLYQIKFLLGCGLCDLNPFTTRIRCFTNDTMTYQFVPYPCDSTWRFSSTNEVDFDKVVIYPNPTTEKVFIDGISLDTDYELYHPNGQILKKGRTYNQMVSLDSNGIFILKIKVNDAWMIRRVIKIE